MNQIRDILNKKKWTGDFSTIEVWYVHRGAPNDTMRVNGDDIITVEKTFLQTSDAMIPHHRVFKIIYAGQVLFDRNKDT